MSDGRAFWGLAAHAAQGQTVVGDRGEVLGRPGGLLAVVADGLGHGEAALRAAEIAVQTAGEAPGATLVEILGRCHERLHGTRGAAVSLALWSEQEKTLTWLGVGNVEGVMVQAGARRPDVVPRLLLRGGVVGDRIPPLHPGTVKVSEGGILVLATDGIAAGFETEVDPGGDPQAIAERVLSRYSRRIDDALVLVVRLVARER